MFKFGDKVIGVDDEYKSLEGIIISVYQPRNRITIMFDSPPKTFFHFHKYELGFDINVYIISASAEHFKKVEPINNCNSDAKNTADQIAKLIDTDKPIDERIIDFCEKLCNKVGAVNIQNQDSLFAACSNVLNYYKSIDNKEQKTETGPEKENISDQIDSLRDGMNKIYLKQKTEIRPEKEQITIIGEDKFGGKHKAKLAEPLKEVTLNLTNKSFKKHKPNKFSKLIKKIVKTELKKMLKKAENE